ARFRAPRRSGCALRLQRAAHRDLALAAIDLPHGGGVAEADQRAPVVGVLDEQALEQQAVDQLAPGGGAELAADAVGGQARLGVADLPGLAEEVVDQAPAPDP